MLFVGTSIIHPSTEGVFLLCNILDLLIYRSQFVLVNVAGKSKVRVKDGLGNEAVFSLNRAHTGIYLPEMIWKDMYDFSEDSVLLVLSSEHYDPEEYIRDYDTFVKMVHTEEKREKE